MEDDISLQLVKSALVGQFRAALATLEQCIALCDTRTWAAPHPDLAVNQVVFHALFFADLYLNLGEAGFRDQSFHRDHRDFFQDYEELEDRVQRNFYPRENCLAFLEFCRAKAKETLNGETNAVLSGDCGFPYRKLTRLELHIYNIRHIQHHAAQLGLRNQLAGGEPLRWIGKA